MTDGESQLDHVAIIGMACRFPGARNLQEFWANLVDGVESITCFSEEELLANGVDPAELQDPNYVRARPVIEDYDQFDAAFFGFTRREAEIVDPQFRLFLEAAFRALEDAGYDSRRYPGEIAVYGGAGTTPYGWTNLRLNPDVLSGVGLLAIASAANLDYVATQTAYRLDLRGPSLTVQCACSTSLAAVHLACEALRHGECDMALAGGSAIEMPHACGYLYVEGGIESPDGHCRPFDAAAQGTVWGSGAGMVLLKRLGDAVRDGDRVYAVIRGTAVNNDGAAKGGFSAPSVEGQAAVVAQALAVAEVDPATIGYVEAHGTGTALGDPIEVRALSEAFSGGAPVGPYCGIGSVKSNIGHLGQAAGVAGLVKTALALHHGAIPPSLNFERPNPRIDFEHSPFYVNSALRSWQSNGTPRRAGVSAFGIGGTNAHLVLEEAPEPEPSGPSRPWQVLMVSAKKPAALSTASAELAKHVEQHPDLSLPDVAFTLHVGRGRHPHRRAVVCQGTVAAGALLAKANSRSVVTGSEPARARSVVFVFPGQGAQHVDMGRELFEREPAFRKEIERCAALLRPDLGLDLTTLLYPAPDDVRAAAEKLDQTWLTQPALFAVEYGLARLLEEWGVRPEAMIGHSIGEYVAACLAGVFSLESALSLVAARGRLMQSLPAGAMLVVQAEPEAVEPLLGGRLDVAAVNGPRLCVVSGPIDAIDELEAEAGRRDLATSRLRTSHAFHSAMMDSILAGFRELVSRAAPGEPRIPFVSNLTGTWITAAEATAPDYWANHLRRAVRFSAGLTELASHPDRVWLEVGPGRGLSGLVRLHAGREAVAAPCLAPPRQGGSDLEALLGAVAQLWVAGVDPDPQGFWSGQRRHRVALPGYPLDRKRHFVDPPRPDAGPSPARRRPAGRLPVEEWFQVPVWRQSPPLPPPAVGGVEAGPWLVFEDEHGLGEALAGRLAELGQDVVGVRAGAAFARHDGGFTIDPSSPRDYELLLQALAEDGREPADVVHAWSVAPRSAQLDVSPETMERDLGRGFYSLLFLAQALAARGAARPFRLTALTSEAQAVSAEEVRRPVRAAVAGPCRVLPTELPQVSCREIDLVLPASRRATERLVDQLLAEVTRPPADELVALRPGERWTRSFEPVSLPPVPEAASRPGLRQRGVYLITGGLGGIGLAVAAELARRCRARLALLARTSLPERERWADWLAEHGGADRTSRRIRAVQVLEEAGSEVLLLSADVADPGQLRAARDQLIGRFGELHGIVHAAGLPGGGMIEVKTAGQAAAVLAPKVAGGAALTQAFGDLELDFVSLCSSVTAVAGGLGQVDYCAANAVLDSLARSGAFGDADVTAVDWGTWLDVGMAAETAVPAAFRELQRGVRASELRHPVLTRALEGPGGEIVFVALLAPERQWLLGEHRVAGVPVLPGAAYLELARAAFEHAWGAGPVELTDVDFETPLAIPDGEQREVRLVLTGGERAAEFRVLSAHGEGWQEHARGSCRRASPAPEVRHDPDAIRARCGRGEETFDGARTAPGMVALGPRWSSLRRVWHGDGEELAHLVCGPDVSDDLARMPLHPALLDEATSFGEMERSAEKSGWLPLAYGSLTLRAPLPPRLYSHLRTRPSEASGIVAADLVLMDETGAEVALIRDFLLRQVSEQSVAASFGGAQPLPAPANGDHPVERAAAPGGGSEETGIRPADGVDAFRRLLAWRPGPQVVVTATDLGVIMDRSRRLTQASLEEELEDVQLVAAGEGERLVDTPYVAPRNEIEAQLVALWVEILGAGMIGVDDEFFALGGNSLVAVQLMSRVRSRLGVKLPMRSLFQAPTVAQMARLVEAARAGAADADDIEIVPVSREEPTRT